MQQYFKRELESLDPIFDYIDKFIEANGINERDAYYLILAIEELFTNMVKYNPDDPGQISIVLKADSGTAVIELIDSCTTPFNIVDAPEYDTSRSIDERPIGGVGIHLIKKTFDDVSYEHKDNKSKITLVKILGEINV